MQVSDEKYRQLMGCGFAPPPPPGTPVDAWEHPGRSPAPDEPMICVGYVARMPEVAEATWAHSFWSKGELSQFCDGENSTPALRQAIAEYESEQAKVTQWESDNPIRKGG